MKTRTIWTTETLYVDLETGEEIKGIRKEILKFYKIIKTTKTYEHTKHNKHIIGGKTRYIFECIKKPKQLKLNII